jgi:hypothetical protein
MPNPLLATETTSEERPHFVECDGVSSPAQYKRNHGAFDVSRRSCVSAEAILHEPI